MTAQSAGDLMAPCNIHFKAIDLPGPEESYIYDC